MVVYNVGKVIGWVSVGFDQDQILQLLVVYCDVSVDYIMEGGCSFCRHVETDYMGLACIQTALYFFLGKLQAAFVIDRDLLACNYALHALQFFLLAEAVVSVSLVYKLFGIFQVNALCLALALYVRSVSAVLIRSLVMKKACLLHGAVNNVNSALYIALLVCIFNTEDEISAFMLGNKICV